MFKHLFFWFFLKVSKSLRARHANDVRNYANQKQRLHKTPEENFKMVWNLNASDEEKAVNVQIE